MKKANFALIMLVTALLAVACTEKNPIEGTWILVEGTYITEDNTLNYPISQTDKRLKVVGKTHFATVWQNPDNDEYCGYNGGSYKYANGIYSESLEFFNDNSLVGTESHFILTQNGDEIKIAACNAMGEEQEFGFFETWKKIE